MMLIIRKQSLNQIALTLSEKQNEANPLIWLFRFVNEQSKKDYFCNLTDLSTSKDRFNLFHLYEGTSITLPFGEYTYEVYQMPITASNVYANGLLCEQGKARVKTATTSPYPTYYNTPTTRKVYE
jgi:hypothetical protein